MTEIERLRIENESLREALGLNVEVPPHLGLRPHGKLMLAILLKRDRISREGLHAAITGVVGSKRLETSSRAVDTQIKWMRKRLRPLGVDIKTDWGFGYFIDPASKGRLRRIMDSADA